MPAKKQKLTNEQVEAAAKRLRPKLRPMLALMALGTVLMGSTASNVINGHLTDTWLETKGQIVTASIVREHRMKFPQKIEAHPDFLYSFQVNNQTVESKDNKFDKTDDNSVSELIAKYPQGQVITVHYLKSNPAVSYFDHPGDNSHSPCQLVGFIAGILLLLSAVVLANKLRTSALAE
ncbi:MAG TPA: DUF3592 domain-containing protein [Oculatellaceae cyanobacterium]